jgi:hypothetical protein
MDDISGCDFELLLCEADRALGLLCWTFERFVLARTFILSVG